MKKLNFFSLLLSSAVCTLGAPLVAMESGVCGTFMVDTPKSYGFSTYADLLCWKVIEGETDYAISGGPTALPPGQVVIGPIGTQQNASYVWKCGFRVGMVAEVPSQDYEVEANYTYFYDKGVQSAVRPVPLYLNGTFDQVTDTALTLATSNIHFRYQLGDLLLAKKISLCPSFKCRLLFGVTGGWIDQDWNVTYFDTNNEKIQEHWSFAGGGFRVGLEGGWAFSKQFEIVGKFSTALLYGSYENNFTTYVYPPASPSFEYANLRSREGRIAPHFQIALGPQCCFHFCGYDLRFYALYELNIVQNLHYVYRNQSSGFINGKPNQHTSSLTGLQGLTLGGSINF